LTAIPPSLTLILNLNDEQVDVEQTPDRGTLDTDGNSAVGTLSTVAVGGAMSALGVGSFDGSLASVSSVSESLATSKPVSVCVPPVAAKSIVSDSSVCNSAVLIVADAPGVINSPVASVLSDARSVCKTRRNIWSARCL